MHILAISGMHVGLLAFFLITVFTWLLTRSAWLILTIPIFKTAVLLSMPFLLFYGLIAGFQPPVLRALLMTAIFLAALFSDRQKTLYPTIALAALIVLIRQPTSLFTASFQLSFTAVLAIATVYGKTLRLLFPTQKPADDSRTKRLIVKIIEWLKAGALISLAATLGTAPLLVYHFNRLSLISPIANLIIEPLICFWALLSGFTAIPLLAVQPDLAAHLLHFGGWGLGAAIRAAHFFATLPGATLRLPPPSMAFIIVYYLLLWTLCRPTKQRFPPRVLIPLALLLITIPLAEKIAARLDTSTQVSFLDVGQGSATLLRLPSGKTILLDGGGPASERFNVGAEIIGPYLHYQGITHLDSVIVSHSHADHFNGLLSIMETFSPKKLWINNQARGDPTVKQLLETAIHHGIEIKSPAPGSILIKDRDATLTCIANPRATEPDKSRNSVNRNSLVLKLESFDHTFLFPGDIDQQREEELLSLSPDLAADILLSPHHGSNGSNSPAFLATVKPHRIIFSVGHRNPFHYPAPQVVKRCRVAGIEMLSTAKNGTISFRINNHGDCEIKLFKE